MNRNNRDFMQNNQMLLPWSPGRTVSVKRAAEIMGVCQATIRNMVDNNELKAYKIRPKKKNSHYRVLVFSIERHIGRVIDTYQLPETRR